MGGIAASRQHDPRGGVDVAAEAAAQAVQELGGIEDFLTIHDHNETPELLSQSAQITNDHNCSMEILKILQILAHFHVTLLKFC